MLEGYYVQDGKNLKNLVDKSTKKEFFQAKLCETGKGSEHQICPFCNDQQFPVF